MLTWCTRLWANSSTDSTPYKWEIISLLGLARVYKVPCHANTSIKIKKWTPIMIMTGDGTKPLSLLICTPSPSQICKKEERKNNILIIWQFCHYEMVCKCLIKLQVASLIDFTLTKWIFDFHSFSVAEARRVKINESNLHRAAVVRCTAVLQQWRAVAWWMQRRKRGALAMTIGGELFRLICQSRQMFALGISRPQHIETDFTL